MTDKEYWIPHLRRLAKNNVGLSEKVRKLEKQVKVLQEEENHLLNTACKQNAEILTLALVLKSPGATISTGNEDK